MSRKPNAVVYIDGANMFYAQKKLGWNIDWKAVQRLLAASLTVSEFRYYTGLKDGDDKMARFLKYLDRIGFTVITKTLKTIRIDGNHPLHRLHNYTEIYKCNFDVEIATDITCDPVLDDEVVLFSGDSDFEYLARKVKAVGRKVTVYASRRTMSWELKLAASRYVYLESHRSQIERT